MISKTRQAAFSIARCAALLLMAASLGCASARPAASPTILGESPIAMPGSAEAPQRLAVERNGFSKKVTFRDLDTSRAAVMKYKGIPVAWGSPLNLLVSDNVYERQSHRVRYRFQHPLSMRPLVILARSKSHRVLSVPVRADDSVPVIQLFDGAEQELQGTLRYNYESRVLFAGEIEGREVEIERVSADTVFEDALLKYFLFPFPVEGDFVVRVEGREAARFTQRRQHGFKSPYDLELEGDMDLATREDAMLAFVVFDLMKDFVQSSAG